MLLSASVLALYPTMTLEKPQSGIRARVHQGRRQSIPEPERQSQQHLLQRSTDTVRLSRNSKATERLELDDLAGSLQIGLANYTITSGKGEVNKKGTIEINAKTSDAGKKLELKLHGRNQGDSVTFDSKKSKLSSLYFLSLTGKAIVTMPTTSISMTESDDEHDHDHYGNNTVTVTQSNTVTETVTQFQNQTLTVTQAPPPSQNLAIRQ